MCNICPLQMNRVDIWQRSGQCQKRVPDWELERNRRHKSKMHKIHTMIRFSPFFMHRPRRRSCYQEQGIEMNSNCGTNNNCHLSIAPSNSRSESCPFFIPFPFSFSDLFSLHFQIPECIALNLLTIDSSTNEVSMPLCCTPIPSPPWLPNLILLQTNESTTTDGHYKTD